jgi:hypothetical protein
MNRQRRLPRAGRPLVALLALAVLLPFCGAGCPWCQSQPLPPLPVVFQTAPSLSQVIEAVNHNNGQIQSFTTNQALLSGPGWPASLRASLAFQRPNRLRLRAETGLTGVEIDLGSNEELFWLWMRRNQPPAVLFCRHDQFASCPARATIPVEPEWLIDALGTTELNPNLPYEAPRVLPGGRLELRSVCQTPDGPNTRVTIVDAVHAVILEQHVFDAQNRLRASAVAEGHRRDPLTGLIMPAAVRLSVPPARFSMRIDLGNVRINCLAGNEVELWRMPSYPGYPAVDLCNPNLQLPGQRPAANAARPRGDGWVPATGGSYR